MSTRFLYYFSVYVNLSKNAILMPLGLIFEAKADAKVTLSWLPSKYFPDYFQKNMKIFRIVDKIRVKRPLIHPRLLLFHDCMTEK